jgi:hypothetical protein
MSPLQSFSVSCCICRNPCNLEGCKTNELGLAVHEDCYVTKLVLEIAAREQDLTAFCRSYRVRVACV